MAVLLLRGTYVQAAAELVEKGPITDYGRPVQVQFSKQVIGDDAVQHTQVFRMEGSTRQTVPVTATFHSSTNRLVLEPRPTWVPGAAYEVVIDAANIRLIAGSGTLDTKPIVLTFGALAHTPTPTNTPTATPTFTPVPAPTNTPEAPSVAESPTAPVVVQTPPVGITAQPRATSTPVPRASATAAPPMGTPAPTHTAALTPEPTDTPVPTDTPTPTHTATAVATATPTPLPATKSTPTNTPTAPPKRTPTPRPGSTSTPSPCDIVPVRGFGKIWQTNADVRRRVGCPKMPEVAIVTAAHQRFEGGYMFWRGDTKTIYVFIGGANDQYGVWRQFADTWDEDAPTPVPVGTPPPGYYAPVRGFGKIWHSDEAIRLALGWALEPEWNVTGAWQTFEHGQALWVSDRIIYFMYSDGMWERFRDTYSEARIKSE
jgi:hypothetical protein